MAERHLHRRRELERVVLAGDDHRHLGTDLALERGPRHQQIDRAARRLVHQAADQAHQRRRQHQCFRRQVVHAEAFAQRRGQRRDVGMGRHRRTAAGGAVAATRLHSAAAAMPVRRRWYAPAAAPADALQRVAAPTSRVAGAVAGRGNRLRDRRSRCRRVRNRARGRACRRGWPHPPAPGRRRAGG